MRNRFRNPLCLERNRFQNRLWWNEIFISVTFPLIKQLYINVNISLLYCHDIVVLWLLKTGFYIGHWNFSTLTQITILSSIHNYTLQHYRYYVQSVCSTYTESSWTAVPHQSSGTGFQRRSFLFLGSRTVPIPQRAVHPELIPSTVCSSLNNWLQLEQSNNWFQLEQSITDYFKFKLYCDRRSVGQFFFVSCPFWSWWPDVTFLWVTIFYFFM
jgi:hypothetical protein